MLRQSLPWQSAVRIAIYPYLPTPPLGQDMTQGQFLSGVLNSEFSFSKISSLTKAEEPCLPYYLPIAGRRIIGFIPFPRVLVLYEMQSVSSRIWTRVVVSISYDDNHYTTGTIYQCSYVSHYFWREIYNCRISSAWGTQWDSNSLTMIF